eukprot:179854-Rhodomonas_salina.1
MTQQRRANSGNQPAARDRDPTEAVTNRDRNVMSAVTNGAETRIEDRLGQLEGTSTTTSRVRPERMRLYRSQGESKRSSADRGCDASRQCSSVTWSTRPHSLRRGTMTLVFETLPAKACPSLSMVRTARVKEGAAEAGGDDSTG